jgi:hypothetical protein
MKIAILCPRGVKTGGPEALHQLCHEIRSLGIDSFLIDSGGPGDSVDEYRKYDAVWRSPDELSTSTHLVMPETILEIPLEIRGKFNGTVVMWWLSVDNSPFPPAQAFESRRFPLPKKWSPREPLWDKRTNALDNIVRIFTDALRSSLPCKEKTSAPLVSTTDLFASFPFRAL